MFQYEKLQLLILVLVFTFSCFSRLLLVLVWLLLVLVWLSLRVRDCGLFGCQGCLPGRWGRRYHECQRPLRPTGVWKIKIVCVSIELVSYGFPFSYSRNSIAMRMEPQIHMVCLNLCLGKLFKTWRNLSNKCWHVNFKLVLCVYVVSFFCKFMLNIFILQVFFSSVVCMWAFYSVKFLLIQV